MDNNYQNDRPIDREVVHTGGPAGRGTTTVAWVALLISILALALGAWAFSRTVDNLDERIQQSVNESMQTVEQGADATGEAVQDAGQATGEAVDDAGEAIDAGPDGVDEDDSDTSTTNQ